MLDCKYLTEIAQTVIETLWQIRRFGSEHAYLQTLEHDQKTASDAAGLGEVTRIATNAERLKACGDNVW
ncbi:hypothetical protein [Sediminimonas qiaohouensis]|uniref:hypothetical protein n=1 Tax=Sediminimonas qiaohouensis TaxID=552061 RepID=UPI0012ED406D|nr:hypothetical protein [Sediminimonas qiaohouensis]